MDLNVLLSEVGATFALYYNYRQSSKGLEQVWMFVETQFPHHSLYYYSNRKCPSAFLNKLKVVGLPQLLPVHLHDLTFSLYVSQCNLKGPFPFSKYD